MSPRDEYLELITARHGGNHGAINSNLQHFDTCDAYAQSVLILIEHGRNAIATRWRTSNALRSMSV